MGFLFWEMKFLQKQPEKQLKSQKWWGYLLQKKLEGCLFEHFPFLSSWWPHSITVVHLWPAWERGAYVIFHPFIKHLFWACYVPGTGLHAGKRSQIRRGLGPCRAVEGLFVNCLSCTLSPQVPSLFPRWQLPFIFRGPGHLVFSMVSDVHWGKNDCTFHLPPLAHSTQLCLQS